jgi:hypothetical protein
MGKHRHLTNPILGDLDTQSWANFVRQTPALMESSRGQSHNDHVGSPMNQTGIERFHQLLSEGSTPRDFTSFHHSGSVRSVSPSQSYVGSRVSTPGGGRTPAYHQSYSKQTNPHSDMIRPSSSASMRDCDNQTQLSHNNLRRGSIQSGYDSNEEESTEVPPRKRAKVYQANWPGKSGMNIERQPSSLRVAASSAASVRIHRPTPVNPALVAEHSPEEPVRPPTPISRPSDFPRRSRPTGSMLRESSSMSISSCPASYTSPYCMSDGIPHTDATGQSPEDTRYQGLFEPSFSMPSSPPVFDSRLPNRSSPVLPTMTLDNDSGFMSTGLDDLQDDDTVTPLDDHRMAEFHGIAQGKRSVRTTVQATSPMSTVSTAQGTNNDPLTIDDVPTQQVVTQAPTPLSRATSRPVTATGTRPSSSGTQRLAPKPLAPAPQIFPNEVPRTLRPIPASDPIVPCRPVGPMDVTFLPCTTASPSSNQSKQPTKPKQAPKQAAPKPASKPVPKNIRARLDKAVQEGIIPPYCENCGSIETASWRRAWVRTVEGGESVAEEMMNCSSMLFWEAVDRNQKGEVQRFKIFKKGLEVDDKEWSQMTFCNPCGLWLHKFRNMRPEDKWTKPGATKPAKKDKKRPSRSRANGSVDSCPATRTRSKAAPKKASASSPAPTEASSVNPEGETPQMEEYDDHDGEAEYSPQDPRATTADLDGTDGTPGRTWSKEDAREALRRAVKSSPAGRAQARSTSVQDANSLTPKPLRRSLFQNAHNEGPLKELDSTAVNSCSPRRSPRIASAKGNKTEQHKENLAPTPGDDLDELFESPSIGFDSTSPTPRRRNPRINAIDKRLSLPANSPNRNKRKDLGSVMTPTRLSAERLQRIQEIHGKLQSSPRSQKSPGKQQHLTPQPADDGLPEGFESIEGMVLDIFDESDKPNAFFGLENDKFGDNWAEWLPTDYVSPAGSSGSCETPANELLNALFSDPTDKDTFNSDLLPFNFNDIVIPDSGFFSSEAHPADVSKSQPAGEDSAGQHANSV